MDAYKREIQLGEDIHSVYVCDFFQKEPEITMFLVHGAGHSAMTWSLFINIFSKATNLRIVAYDLRGHGDTRTTNDSDMSIETLVADFSKITREFEFTTEKSIVVGHSLGGIIAAKAVFTDERLIGAGLALLDVVEKTGRESIGFMRNLLRGRPYFFQEVGEAVEWVIKSGLVTNRESAVLSVPSMLTETTHKGKTGLGWKVNLVKSEKYWLGWYEGLTDAFLKSKSFIKILVLTDYKSLDGKELLKAQMEGSFITSVFQGSGHCIQEDKPGELASLIYGKMKRLGVQILVEEETRN